VHVGEQPIGRIPAANAKPRRQILAGHGVAALAVGEDPATGWIELHLPDRPRQSIAAPNRGVRHSLERAHLAALSVSSGWPATRDQVLERSPREGCGH
jgi:hypothetical protein